jgi:S-formylglutathione hydrolase FrmB
MPHAIVVLPDCFTRYGGSQYINSGATGRYEDYVIDEIIPWVDAHYRTLTTPQSRGVFGKSSGGYGSMILGMRHPEVFGALACHSGDMFFDLCYAPDFPKACNRFNTFGGVKAWWKQFEAQVKKNGADFDALNILRWRRATRPIPARRSASLCRWTCTPANAPLRSWRAGWTGIRWSCSTTSKRR